MVDTAGFEHTVTDPDGDTITTGHDVRGNTVSTTSCHNQTADVRSTEYFTYYPDDTTAQLTTADPRNDLMLTSRDGRSASATPPPRPPRRSPDSRPTASPAPFTPRVPPPQRQRRCVRW